MGDGSTILAVDDSAPYLVLLVGVLTRAGYRVLVADGGEVALEGAVKNLPHLILLDVFMEGMDGLEVCRQLKLREETRHIPVILMSGSSEVSQWVRGLQLGAADYISKPFQVEELLTRVRTHLALRQARVSLEEQAVALRQTNLQLHSEIARRQEVEDDLRATLGEAARAHESMLNALEDQKRAELAVRELEERFATAFRCSPVSMAMTSTTTNCYVDVNDMFVRSTGFTREQIIGHTSVEMGLFHDSSDRQRLFAEVSRRGFAYCLEMRFCMKSGEIRDGLISAQMIQLHGEPHMLVTILDVTERREADKRLRASEAKFRCLFDSSCDAIVMLAPSSQNFTDGNPAALAIFGAKTIADLTSRGPAELSPERQPDGRSSRDAARELCETAMGTGSISFGWVHKRIDGQEFPATVLLTRMELGGNPFLQGTIRDISEQRRIEMELGHARKLEAVGQLAAGIAHEINTPAQYVGDGVHFLKSAFEGYQRLLGHYRNALESVAGAGGHEALVGQIRETEEEIDLPYLDANVPGSLESCLDGVSRISTIVRAMKAFAHPDQTEMAPADLNQALQTTLTIARNEYKYVAEVMTDLGNLPPVLCHVGDLNQVFLNLIVNAAHAIGDVVGQTGSKGQIQIKTSSDGTSVRIDVADTGTGIPEAIRQRVFEPFFTTKETGKGSGQGLAIAHSIVVNKHRGSLTFESEVGKGTTFTIRLPIDDGVDSRT